MQENGKNRIGEKKITSVGAEDSPFIPQMSSEAWELIEYRLWHKFSVKLWAIIGGFLVLSSIAGLLGIPAYIEKNVEKQILSEKKNVENLRLSIEKKYVTHMIRTNLLGFLFQKYRKDSFAFQRASDKAYLEINEITDTDMRKHFNDILEKLRYHRLMGTDFKKLIVELCNSFAKKDANQDNHAASENLNSDHWKKLELVLNKNNVGSISEVFQIYIHLMALRAMISNTELLILKPQLESDVLKAQLYSEYEEEIYPAYEIELKKYALPYSGMASSTGEFGWSTLWNNAFVAFVEYESKLKNLAP